MKLLDLLRPAKNPTAAELRAKRAEAEQQAADLAERVADMERQRGPLLLDGTPAEVRAAEAALAAARDELAAVSAIASTLAERADAADHAEAMADYRAEVDALHAEVAQIADWMKARLPTLAGEMRAIAAREGAACDRILVLAHRQRALAERFPDAVAIGLPTEPLTAAGGMGRFGEILRLPALRHTGAAG